MDEVVGSFRADLFAGKAVLVSGATSGIGLAIAEGFVRLGAEVIGTGSSAGKIAAEKDAHPRIRFARLDVRNLAEIEAFAKTLPKLDVLVNVAGIARPEAEYEDATYLEVMDVNLNAAMRLTMATLPQLRKSRGSVINFASMLSYLADEGVPAYGASKTGLMGLTRALAHRFGRDGIRVNAVAPGYHKTAMTEALWSVPADAERIANRSAMKRWGTVDDLVGTVIFLASPASLFVTATTIPVDGGYSVG